MLSQFFISSGSQAPYWLDGKHVVFGKVRICLAHLARGPLCHLVESEPPVAWPPFLRIRH